jgi:hypothetical protein
MGQCVDTWTEWASFIRPTDELHMKQVRVELGQGQVRSA